MGTGVTGAGLLIILLILVLVIIPLAIVGALIALTVFLIRRSRSPRVPS